MMLGRPAVDSSCNRVAVLELGVLAIAELIGAPGHGYVARRTAEDAAFGDDACPCSHGWAVMWWFGPGEMYPDAQAALDAAIACLYEEEEGGGHGGR